MVCVVAGEARIRGAAPDDAEAIAAIYRPVVLETGISFDWEPPTAEAWRERIAKVTTRYPWLVALDDHEEVAGFAYANTHRDAPSYQWSVNTSVYIRDDQRGRGLGKVLYARLFDELAGLGNVHAFAGVALPNPASVALHDAVGFRHLGTFEKVGFKLGQWRDVAWFQRPLQTPPDGAQPLPPRRPAA